MFFFVFFPPFLPPFLPPPLSCLSAKSHPGFSKKCKLYLHFCLGGNMRVYTFIFHSTCKLFSLVHHSGDHILCSCMLPGTKKMEWTKKKIRHFMQSTRFAKDFFGLLFSLFRIQTRIFASFWRVFIFAFRKKGIGRRGVSFCCCPRQNQSINLCINQIPRQMPLYHVQDLFSSPLTNATSHTQLLATNARRGLTWTPPPSGLMPACTP